MAAATITRKPRARVLPGHGAPPRREWMNDALLEDFRRVDPAELQGFFTGEPPAGVIADRQIGPALPDSTSIGSLRHGELRIIQPIEVRFSTEDSQCIAEAPEFNESGFGTTRSEALADLQFAIAELYFELKSEQSNLGPDLMTIWGKMSQAIKQLEHKTA